MATKSGCHAILDAGVPPCAITTMDDLNVMAIAATGHLA
jgi:hypothetical protein